MLEKLDTQSPDALLALIKLHREDPREDKIDLGVGVYRDEEGETPVFRSIKAAEAILHDRQDSKSYLGPEGDIGFVNALMPYVFGNADPTMGGRIAGMQTPGGPGAVRLAFALAQAALHPSIDLVAVTTCWGDTVARARLAGRVLTAAGRDRVPIHPGPNTSLTTGDRVVTEMTSGRATSHQRCIFESRMRLITWLRPCFRRPANTRYAR